MNAAEVARTSDGPVAASDQTPQMVGQTSIELAASEYHLLRNAVGQLAEVVPRQQTRAPRHQPENLVLDDVDEGVAVGVRLLAECERVVSERPPRPPFR